MPNPNPFFMTATRQELDVTLLAKPGYQVPTDLSGHVYINSSVGTVNSGGLPFPATRPDGSYNPEQGSPLLGGDGMVYRYDLDQPGQVRLKSRLLRPPCFYADEATRYWDAVDHQPNPLYHTYGFRNFGLSRMSLLLGVRNELCTAVLPMRFARDPYPRILANYDAGRPYEFDAQTLQLKTPIGANPEWTSSLPPFLVFPFPLVQSTAHPVFDPVTQELFTVNFTKSFQSLASDLRLFHLLRLAPDQLEQQLEARIAAFRQRNNNAHPKDFAEAAVADLNDFFGQAHKEVHVAEPWWQELLDLLEKLVESWIKKETTVENAVYTMRWRGQGEWEKWKVIDADTGQPIAIQQCMHQTGLSQDYLILIDAGFKLTLDIMMNNPFPNNPEIDKFIRQILTAAMLDHTPTWIVRRADLVAGQATVRAKALPQPLDFETIHFSANYANPGGHITLFCAHNCTGCFAEWARFYDQQHLTGQTVPPEVVGIPPSGIMDINRIGRYVIDAATGQVVQKDLVALTGNPANPEHIGPNTWGLVLYTYRGMISADQPVAQVKYIYWQMYGLDQTLLTDFMFQMYKDYRHRLVPVPDLEKYTAEGVPFSLGRMNMETMQFEDYYQFQPGEVFRSIQFVPRAAQAHPPVPEGMDGYIFCTVIVNVAGPGQPLNYESQIWLFDAANLAQGPVSKLYHPELFCGSTLHSAWLAQAQSSPTYYDIDVRADYQPLIDKTFDGLNIGPLKHLREEIQHIFNQYVFPHF
jgi:Retinal pigment epithelial membrane protein